MIINGIVSSLWKRFDELSRICVSFGPVNMREHDA